MKRIINTILLLSVAIIAMAQTSFVVADKNGNSQLVQSLVFQQQQTADRFSWKSDGLANGDINDLLFIARAKNQLSTANTEDVTKMLEELSGTDLADAEGIAAALKKNPQVEEASSEDGGNVVVKMKDSNSHIVYPLYEDADIISDFDFLSKESKIAFAPRESRYQGDVYNGKVAIFNHFSGISGYRLQNRIVSNIKVMFELNGYDVAYYGTNPSYEYNGNIDYEQYFDHRHLNDVIENSREYDAILIFSHGYIWNGKSYFATGEKIMTSPGDELSCYEKEDGEYYLSYPVEALKTNNKCIVYLGSCYGIPSGGYTEGSFISEKNSCFIGWNGKNRIAQADAMVLFNYMLNESLTLDQAVKYSCNTDPWNEGVQRFEYNTSNHSLNASSKPVFTTGKSLELTSIQDFYRKEDKKEYWEIKVKAKGNWDFYAILRIKLESLLNDVTDLPYEHFSGFLFSEKEQVTHIVVGPQMPEGLYKVYALTLEDGEWKRLKVFPPLTFLYSWNLSDNYSAPEPPSDMTRPVILGSDGQPLEEITIPAGTSQTYHIDAYPGHAFETPCLDKSVCDVSVSGNTLTVKGLKEGSTIFGVFDVQNRQMSVVQATVTAGGGGDIVAYSSCPDDHHPHMIDLGLPSGTKWACCNVGAEKPEDYGGYYAWGETSEKSRYYWDTYIHCDGSESTCHDIGKDIAGTQYDAATANWGSPWVMPNKEQMEELKNSSTSEWTTENGVNGRRFTGPNGASIFLPASGRRWNDGLGGAGLYGYYWSSSLYESTTDGACDLDFHSGGVYTHSDLYRSLGPSVRPVRKN